LPSAIELLREGRTEELWQKCCGFIDLSIQDFMSIQKRLLLEQLDLINNCELGQQVMKGAKPRTLEEFREMVPVTTYADYTPYLTEKIEDALPVKPRLWQRTSGRSEEYTYKWVPITDKIFNELGDIFLAVLIFASCKGRNDIVLEEHDKFLYAVAPPPYATGCLSHRVAEEGIFDFLPPMDIAENMAFEERMAEGFKLALTEGMNMLFALTGLLLAIGEQFGQGGSIKRLKPLLTKPGALFRILRALTKSKLAGRSLLPRDIWKLKLLVGFGTDTAIYRDKLYELWGRYPLDVYGSTEGVMMAVQTWDYESMTFVPHINLLEFMPQHEHEKWKLDPSYKPELLLLDEVNSGETYGIVITNFHGGAYIRYFLGDMVDITSLRNTSLDIDIPQMTFNSRADGLIEMAGFVRLTERTIWEAIELSGVNYIDWIARSEQEEHREVLRLYLETADDASRVDGHVANSVHEHLKKLDTYYSAHSDLSDLRPLEIVFLPQGAFQSYIAKQRAAGADLAHLKPPHINPSDDVVNFMLNSSA